MTSPRIRLWQLFLSWFGRSEQQQATKSLLEFLARANKPAVMCHPDTIAQLPKGIRAEMPMYGVRVLTDPFAAKGELVGVDLAYMPKISWSSIALEIDFGIPPSVGDKFPKTVSHFRALSDA